MASCRTIKGKTYRLEPTEGKCQRGRPKGAAKPRSAPPAARGVQLPPEVEDAIARGVLPDEAEQRRRYEKAMRPKIAPPPAPAVAEIVYSVEPAPAGGGYDLIASSATFAKRLAHYGSRDEAKRAREVAIKTGQAPPPKGPTQRLRTPLRVNDHRVLERQEREREHEAREARNQAAREQFGARAPERSSLASAGRLPPKPKPAEPAEPALKSTEREALKVVRRRNQAGLLYTPDATSPTLRRLLGELAARGHVREYGHGSFYMPEFAGDLEGLAASTARLRGKKAPRVIAYVGAAGGRSRSDYDVRRQPVVPLPPPIDPATASVGQAVSVFSYNENEPAHGTLTHLPGAVEHGRVATEPTVHFLSGAQAGMNRYIRWDRVFGGWLDPNVNWKPWKG